MSIIEMIIIDKPYSYICFESSGGSTDDAREDKGCS